MKKLILIFVIVFSFNVKAQDTSYYLKQQQLYRRINEKVLDSFSIKKYRTTERIRREKTKDALFHCGMILTFVVSLIISTKKY
jgi:hypothetical protein